MASAATTDAAAAAPAPAGAADATGRDPSLIVLFDVDGTLTPARKKASAEILEFLKTLRKKVYIGMVGGSDLVKQKEQLGEDLLGMFDYIFAENGLVAFKQGELLGSQTLKKYLGEDKLKQFINFTLKYLADLDIPIKRGTFMEFRTGMINVSPIGRNCSREERNEFEKFDKGANVRRDMVKVLEDKFGDEFNLKFSIGGQISFDVFPKGWDKTYCLQFLEKDNFKTIHFFGDKTYQGGNDYEIFASEKTEGHTTTGPEETMKMCQDLFLA